MSSVEEFIALRERLQFCPLCACKLFDDPNNRAYRVCLVHGRVFAVMQVVGGYKVEVYLDAR